MSNATCLTAGLLIAMFGQVQDAPSSQLHQEGVGRVTMGGTQYWTDHFVCHDWRIQRNVQFGQFRLLKPTNRVAHSGSYEACRQAFDVVRARADFPPIPATVLVTLHGLGRTRNSMSAIGKCVSTAGGFGWINVGYASTRDTIDEHAKALRHVLDELAALRQLQEARSKEARSKEARGDGRSLQVHFVAHSLGNIVIRKLLSELQHDAAHLPAWHVGRMVMLGPPNQGSALADLLKKNDVFRLLAGSSGKDLGADWEQLQKQLVTPSCEFAIIAGGRGDGKGFNPLLSGDDDLVVRVEETKLSGATDFDVIPSIHTVLMQQRDVQAMSLRFLQHGYLKTAAERHPVVYNSP